VSDAADRVVLVRGMKNDGPGMGLGHRAIDINIGF
jgi:hypothetical protein